jgi:pimeloyl-ACP methyl ester carboxylesterase
MPAAIRMPKLGMSMEDGAVVEWPVALGGYVEKGQVVLVIENDKAEAEIEATASGYLRHIYVEADPECRLACGSLLAALTETPDAPFDAEAFHAAESPVTTRPVSTATAAPATPRPAASSAAQRAGAVPAAPAARALARKHGIELERVVGTGPGGRILREDVQAWIERRERLVEVADGVALDVPQEGTGDPVILLPGFGSDVSAFALQTPELAKGWCVRAVNPRGVGQSDAPEEASYTVTRLASDAAALIDAPAHVVGASLGAAVALELALAHPGKVRSLTLITPFLEATPRLLAVIDAWVRVSAASTPDAVAALLLPWLFSPRFLADEAAVGRVRRGLIQSAARIPSATLERTAAGLRAWSGTRGADLTGIDAPALVLAAGDDLLVDDVARVAAALPRARLEIVPDAGHALALEAPDPVNRTLRDHLQAS